MVKNWSAPIPGREGHVGGTAADNRLFVEAVLYRYHVGIPWRDLPTRFGDGKNVHRQLRRWCESGVIERIFRHLTADHGNEYMMVDSTIVRAQQHNSGTRKRETGHRTVLGRLITKVPVIVNTMGKVVALSLTPRERADSTEAKLPLDEVNPEAFIADKAYDDDPLIEKLKAREITPVIFSKKNRISQSKIRFSIYKKPNIIE